MESVLRSHDVSSDFLSTLYAAGWPPRESEEGFGNAIENRYVDSSFGDAPSDVTLVRCGIVCSPFQI